MGAVLARGGRGRAGLSRVSRLPRRAAVGAELPFIEFRGGVGGAARGGAARAGLGGVPDPGDLLAGLEGNR